MKPLLLAEAAQFLRMSRSTLYQRKDIPRFRRPGSRVMLFDQDELEAWLRQGRIGGTEEDLIPESVKPKRALAAVTDGSVLDFPAERVYHRNARYR
jgi:predicted DNA-binding transcriptional regulator AlpA